MHADPLIAAVLKELKHEDMGNDDVRTWNNEIWNKAIKAAVRAIQKHIEDNHEQRDSK